MSSRPTRKWSSLRGLAVVTLGNGTKVGTVENFYFEPQGSEIRAFRVKTGMMHYKMLASGVINGIGEHALTIQDEDLLRDERDQPGLDNLLPGQTLMSYRVMSTSGNIVGTIGEILLDVSTPLEMHIDSYELSRNLLQHFGQQAHVFSSNQVSSYGTDVVVIPEQVALSLK